MQTSGSASDASNLATYARTVRYLRPKQVLTRIKHRLIGYSDDIPPIEPGTFQPQKLLCDPLTPRVGGVRGLRSSKSKITFLGQTKPFPFSSEGGEPATLLWQFNYHYLDWLWQLSDEELLTYYEHWSENHLFGNGAAWHPYVVSKRLINLSMLCRSRLLPVLEADERLKQRFALSIWQHLFFLRNNFEYDVDVNHLLTNLIAAAVGASCFDSLPGRTAEELNSLLVDELDKQFLFDGGHIERSPGYQLELTYQLAHLLNCGTDISNLGKVVEDSLEVVSSLSDSAGEPFLFNDGTVEETVLASDLTKYVSRIIDKPLCTDLEQNDKAILYRDSGYCRINSGSYSLTADFGPLGAAHNCGHGHADFLSFILYNTGKPLIVDAGNSDYERGALRTYFRSTRAHSTLELNSQSCAELWSAFRVGRRSTPKLLDFKREGDTFTLIAMHEGYKHLPGSPIVVRRLIVNRQAVIVADYIFTSESIEALGRFHIHPMWNISADRNKAVLRSKYDTTETYVYCSAQLVVEHDHFFSPGFGKVQPGAALSYKPLSTASGAFAVSVFANHNLDIDFSTVPEHRLALDGQTIDWSAHSIELCGQRI